MIDVAQVLEQLRPARMVRQDARVHHVRVAEHEVRARANRPARVLRRVAVVGEHADLLAEPRRDRLAHRLQLGELILRERLGRKQIQRAARRILQDRIEHRRVVAERLARRGRRDHDDVPAGERVLDRLGLVRVELRDAARRRARASAAGRAPPGNGANCAATAGSRRTAVTCSPAYPAVRTAAARRQRCSSAASSALSVVRDAGAGSMAQHRTSEANKWQTGMANG